MKNNPLPADILGPCVAHVRPVRISASLFWIQLPEGIDEAFLKQFSEAISLLLSEPWSFLVTLGIGQIWGRKKKKI